MSPLKVRGKSRDVPSSARSGKEVRINSVAPYSTGSLKLGTNTRSGPVEIAKRQFAGYKIGVNRGITETMQIDVRDILARNAVFAVLSPARRRALAESGTQVKLEKGQKLFSRGDEPDAAYPIISGEIEVSITGPDGRNVFIARLPGGSVVGEMGVLDGVARSTDAHATRKSILWRIERSLVFEALSVETGSALALLAVMARRLRETDALVDRNASMNLGKRLARLLLEESVHGKIIYNQADIAHLIGATREAVNRKLAEWRKAKFLEINHTGLHVLDRHALLGICRRKAAI